MGKQRQLTSLLSLKDLFYLREKSENVAVTVMYGKLSHDLIGIKLYIIEYQIK